jgi:hypothetical protein
MFCNLSTRTLNAIRINQIRLPTWLRDKKRDKPTRGCNLRGKKGSSAVKYCSCECGKRVNTRHNVGQAYASVKCQREHAYRQYIQSWFEGRHSGINEHGRISRWIRRWVLERDQCKCILCGWGETNPHTGEWALIVDHTDGDSSRTVPENLRTLCPNCDALQPTYKGANRGHGRVSIRRASRLSSVG